MSIENCQNSWFYVIFDLCEKWKSFSFQKNYAWNFEENKMIWRITKNAEQRSSIENWGHGWYIIVFWFLSQCQRISKGILFFNFVENSSMLKLKWIVLSATLVLISVANSMPGPGTGPPGPPIGPPCWAPPCVPIDSALVVLLLGGAGLGVKFLFRRKWFG